MIQHHMLQGLLTCHEQSLSDFVNDLHHKYTVSFASKGPPESIETSTAKPQCAAHTVSVFGSSTGDAHDFE